MLLSIHVLAAVLTIGPVIVAASMFPRYARAVQAYPDAAAARAALAVLHRVCRVYAVIALFVPVFGLATASSLGVLTDPWVLVSIGLTVKAALLLVVRILPGQQQVTSEPAQPMRAGDDRRLSRLGATSGAFALL